MKLVNGQLKMIVICFQNYLNTILKMRLVDFNLFIPFYNSQIVETLCNTDSSHLDVIRDYAKTMLLLEETLIQCSQSLSQLILLFLNKGLMSKTITDISLRSASCLRKVT